MVDFKLIYPVGKNVIVTQTFAEHLARAKANGWCTKPGPCPRGIYYYPGIDYGCLAGTLVRAAFGGVVEDAQMSSVGYGHYVKIRHPNGMLTVYGHNGELLVKKDDRPYIGDPIAFSNNSGNSTGNHLHFELRNQNGVPIDPTFYLEDVAPEEPIDELPKLPARAVLTASPAVRLGPSRTSVPVGGLSEGIELDALEFIDDDEGIVWVRYSVYSAYEQGGYKYMEFKK